MSALGERHLGVLAQRSVEARGDYPSLLFEGRWHGSGELFSRAQRLAAGLAELGIAPGDRVVVCMA
ncbi:MAG: AMP-binding protein, partial [Solirubrobacteraceae bacterium]